jgi:glyoxylase-like metal-dependent hydrolase (beta-lactamase superfamily II)
VCYYLPEDKALITGDTLFRGTIGRTDLPGGEYDDLIVSVMEKLMGLDGEVQIFPGHGPSSTITDERTNNPFLQPFNEPWEGIDSID